MLNRFQLYGFDEVREHVLATEAARHGGRIRAPLPDPSPSAQDDKGRGMAQDDKGRGMAQDDRGASS